MSLQLSLALVLALKRWNPAIPASLVARAMPQIISLVHSAGVTVIVPNVDTPEQAEWWRCAGADTAWGTHSDAPAPNR